MNNQILKRSEGGQPGNKNTQRGGKATQKERNKMTTKTKRDLGPLSETPCKTCGRRHHRYAWPKKCLEASEQADYAAELAYDKKAYAVMSPDERDAHDNL